MTPISSNLLLEARDVTVRMAEKSIVHEVSLALSAGCFVAVLGPNGAGKSTLLRALSGEIAASQGEVLLGGKPFSEWPRRTRAQRIAVLPQESRLAYPLPAFEIALMGRAPHINGVESADDFRITTAALESTGVAHLARRNYSTLSGGEKARVQMARVLAQIWPEENDTDRFLLLDEPTAALDCAHQLDILGLAKNFARNGTGVLAILHDINLAARFADEIVLMNSGRILAQGTPVEVLTPIILRDTFGIEALVLEHPRLACPLIVPVDSVSADVKSFGKATAAR